MAYNTLQPVYHIENFLLQNSANHRSSWPTERSLTSLELQDCWDSAVTLFLKTTLRPKLSRTSPVPSSLMLKHTWPFSTWTLTLFTSSIRFKSGLDPLYRSPY
ncbi:hypothetical protein PAMP_009744 [Pampus punctatissimus]